MQTKLDLKAAVAFAQANLRAAEKALAEFNSLAENNVFDDKRKAEGFAENACDNMAHEDCEGAGNCGESEYTQDYMVNGEKFRCTATYEYNRHDKTYYYIDGRDYKHEAI